MERNRDIRYINSGIPPFKTPQLNGTYYFDDIPDTLDLAERASLAVHGITEMTDPDSNCESYIAVLCGAKPPLMYHDINDRCEAKCYASTPLLRTVCGSVENGHVDRQRMATLMQMQGGDGLFYETVAGRPWAKDFGFGGEVYKQQLGAFYAPIHMLGRWCEAALVYWKLTGDQMWKEMALKAVLRATELLVDRGSYGYYVGPGCFMPGEGVQDGPLPPNSLTHVPIWTAIGALAAYRMTGFEPALALTQKIAEYLVRYSGLITPDGDFGVTHTLVDGTTVTLRHFHTNTLLRGFLLDLGLTVNNKEYVGLAKSGYSFGKRYGDTLMGFFPEFLDTKNGAYGMTCEICVGRLDRA